MPPWIISNAKKIFVDKKLPDYKAFLKWLYYYCDQGDKAFVFEASDGKTYTEEDGLKKYLEETSDYDNSMNLAPNLIKLKDGKADEESAFSCVTHSPKSYPRYHEYQPSINVLYLRYRKLREQSFLTTFTIQLFRIFAQ